jgi:hypothetical protein
MKKIRILLILCCFAWPSGAGGEQLQSEIDHLMDYVRNSDCQFIRNGKAHKSDEAVEHILRKYDRFKDKIKTTEDFIDYCASKSLLSKKPYKIGCPDQEWVDSKDWFIEELKRFRNR